MVNCREGWRGHLWQGRFASFVLDEPYLLTAARYVELNPVRAGLINAPRRYRWSRNLAPRAGGGAKYDVPETGRICGVTYDVPGTTDM
jgi:hypothetical protein